MGTNCSKGVNTRNTQGGSTRSEPTVNKARDNSKNVHVVSDVYSIHLQCFTVSTKKLTTTNSSHLTKGCKHVAVSKITVHMNEAHKVHKLSSVMHMPVLTWSGMNVKAQFPQFLPMNLWPGDYATFGFFHPDTSASAMVTLTGKVGAKDVLIESEVRNPPALPDEDIEYLTKLLQEEFSKHRAPSASKEESCPAELPSVAAPSTRTSQDTGYTSYRMSTGQSPYSGLNYTVVESSDSDDANPKPRAREKRPKLKRKDTPSQHVPFTRSTDTYSPYKSKLPEGPLLEEAETATVDKQSPSDKDDGQFDVDDCSDTVEDNQQAVNPIPHTPVHSPKPPLSPLSPIVPSMLLYDTLTPLSPSSPKLSTELYDNLLARSASAGRRQPTLKETAHSAQDEKTALWLESQAIYAMPGRLTRSAQDVKNFTENGNRETEPTSTHSLGPSSDILKRETKKKKLSISSKLASKQREPAVTVPPVSDQLEAGMTEQERIREDRKAEHEGASDADDEYEAKSTLSKMSTVDTGVVPGDFANKNDEKAIERVESIDNTDTDKKQVPVAVDTAGNKDEIVKDKTIKTDRKGRVSKVSVTSERKGSIKDSRISDSAAGKVTESAARNKRKSVSRKGSTGLPQHSIADVIEKQVRYSEIETRTTSAALAKARPKSVSRTQQSLDIKIHGAKGGRRSSSSHGNHDEQITASRSGTDSSPSRPKAQSVSAANRSTYQYKKMISLEESGKGKQTARPKKDSMSASRPMEAFTETSEL